MPSEIRAPMSIIYILHNPFEGGDEYAVYINRQDAEHAAHATGAEIIPCTLILSGSSPVSEPREIEIPGNCFHCSNRKIKPHCSSPGSRCFWVRCDECRSVSAMVLHMRVYLLPNGERRVHRA